jgi:hypothetical protein
MKHLKGYTLFESNSKLDSSELEMIFAHTFDLSKEHSIDIIYFDPDNNEWACNDWSNPNSDSHPDFCIEGFCVIITHNFYSESDLDSFNEYLEIMNELKSDIERFKVIYSPSYIGIKHNSDKIEILIKP